MRFLIITGLSGAGKTQVIHFLEDIGYYCIDNMPPVFLTTFAKVCYTQATTIGNVAIVVDIRGGALFDTIGQELDNMKAEGFPYEILFLEADDATLIKRYKETRRAHPLSPSGLIGDGITRERERLAELRQRADTIIDTSQLLTRQLKKIVNDKYGECESADYFNVQVQSFGFKYGVPSDADLMFDVRFLPNPYYVEGMREQTGKDAAVREFVMSYAQTQEFLTRLSDMLTMLLPYYIEEGKNQLVVAIGCTGGRHRSVAIAERIGQILAAHGTHVSVSHRDIER